MKVADRPFRGERPYRYEDRDLFFGRSDEVQELLDALGAHRIVLLYGPAGSGRTSLIEAGLLPAARERGISTGRVRIGDEVTVGDGALLIADRFEDVLTLFAARERQVAAAEAVLAAEGTLLLSFREEHLAAVLELLGDREAAHVRVVPPPPEAVDDIVRGPFCAHPGRFEHELGGRVAERLADAYDGELGGLQRACDRLWDADRPEELLERHGAKALLADEPVPTSAPAPRPLPGDEAGDLTPAERRLRWLLIAHALWSTALAVGYLANGDTSSLGFMSNSFAKDVLFVALSLLAAAFIRRHGWLTLLVVAGYVGLVIGQAATLLWGGAQDQDVLGLFEVSGTVALLAWMAADLVLIVWFTAWWIAAVRSRWDLKFLHPVAFLSLIALSEVLIEGEHEAVPPRDIARNVDGYLARLDARGKGRVQLALLGLCVWPVLTARPPLPALDPRRRKRFLERRFLADVSERRTFAPLRPIVRTMIRVGSQMSYLGYYGDRRSWPTVGYTPFRDRPGGRAPTDSDRPEPALGSLTQPPAGRYDTIVIGSGAAGGLLAYRFAAAGRRVLVLERGPHVDPRTFTDDEVDQYLRLYNEGALQLATNFGLQVLQGMCVGGGTTINNALCLQPPGEVLDQWAERGIERAALERAIGEVRRFLPVGPIHEARTTTPAARRFATAAAQMGLPGRVELMEVNISDRCLGCGYCNIGCAYGAKLSMLDTALPWAQRDFPGRLDVLPDFEALRIVTERDRAVAVRGRYAGDEITLSADEVVISAGALHSSYLLQRSGLGGSAVGRGLHFNINSPLTAEFPDRVDAFAGLQMSHAYVPGNGVPGYLVETWFNPPATQALSMPGWFSQHFENMLRYRNMACGGTLVGTTTPGLVKPGRHGPEIEYTPSATDMKRLIEGMKVMSRIFLAAGARRVMPATHRWHEFADTASLDDLDAYVGGSGDLLLTSAHPQGGNAIGDVVGPDFRVNGLQNLYLCDASVFPSSVSVNPQLTVMGMAWLAADTILGPARNLSGS
jgi:choline dehydrogenase-like flavoprotein